MWKKRCGDWIGWDGDLNGDRQRLKDGEKR